MSRHRTSARRLLILAVLLASLGGGSSVTAVAQSRGLEVTLKASEAPGAPSSGTVQLYRASHALVIGIDAYTGGWSRLSNGVKDARLVADELRRAGFDVTLKTDLKSAELRPALQEFFAVKGQDPEARLLFWYAGHGHTIGSDGYLVPADAPATSGPDFLLKALPMRDFGSLVRLARAKHVLSIFDSCFAGTVFEARDGLPPPAITAAATRPVRQFITAGDASQRVRDDGSFREYFLRALRGEERADFNDDGYVTGEELGLFLRQRVEALTQAAQTPKSGKLHDVSFNQGDFVFAVPRGTTAPRLQPSIDLRQADVAFWQSIQGSAHVADFEDYLKQFPKGQFRSLAIRRRDALRQPQAAVVPPPPPATPPTARPVQPAVGSYPQGMAPGTVYRDCTECPEMVVVPAGSFTMGSPENERNRYPDEGPQHRVTIPRSFSVGKYEVTFAEWDACVAGGGCGGHRPGDSGWGRGNRPVINVGWDDAKTYVEWLSGKTGKSYRLLSESEWEYAARGGTTTRYWWGDEIGRNNANCDGCGSQWDNKQTGSVGSFKANGFGLHDMLGNVWEWVEDCWHDSYAGAPADGSAWTAGGNCGLRVLRGGSWLYNPGILRAASRNWYSTGFRSGNAGFRVARTQ